MSETDNRNILVQKSSSAAAAPESTARYAFIADTTMAAAVEAGSSNLKLLETVA